LRLLPVQLPPLPQQRLVLPQQRVRVRVRVRVLVLVHLALVREEDLPVVLVEVQAVEVATLAQSRLSTRRTRDTGTVVVAKQTAGRFGRSVG
jgi:hypothetical protein